jgi:cytochrome d ubiquinol oxidase subunit II
MASGDPANNLTIANTITGSYGLLIAIRWWTIGMVFAVTYFVVLYRMFRGKLTTEAGDSHGY